MRRPLQLFFACLIMIVMNACATPKQPPIPIGNIVLGVAPFSHPSDVSQMLAGYMHEDVDPISSDLLVSLDALFAQELRNNSQNIFKDSSQANSFIAMSKNKSSRPKVALDYWVAVGKAMKVDILIVPQVLEWQDSSIGKTKPARIVLDFFVINVKENTLISRSHTDEEQIALSTSVLEAGKTFKYNGKLVTGHELAQESMKKAIKELGL